ncbi:MAG TPA: glutaminyl-peptide cyclotransferase [Candidatus Sumerlaeota bacterium]|nr:glutaminyl-peptide cyclotransferase [Candidatus Sumerlaeota bacterium]
MPPELKIAVYTLLAILGMVAPLRADVTSDTLKLSPKSTMAPDGIERLKVTVINRHPHDSTAFTQGLLLHDGKLYESTGLRGRSSLRRVDPVSGTVEQEVPVEEPYFAEGLALVGDHLIQITWQEQKALVYDLKTFQRIGELPYQGEGWGLCHDGAGKLFMSNGTSEITIRDPKTFSRIGAINVTLGGREVRNLNELEWADGYIYANIWQRMAIVKIDPATGKVVATIRVADLLTPEEQRGVDVLNGIAYDPATKHFLITGKFWPVLFEVTFTKDSP